MAGRNKARVLFLCTHNSARSQMAEGLLRHFADDRYEAFSAGTVATGVRPLAVRAMAELGIDIAGQESKTLDRYLDEPFATVITVCDDANESCPISPARRGGCIGHSPTRARHPARRTSKWQPTAASAMPSGRVSRASCWIDGSLY